MSCAFEKEKLTGYYDGELQTGEKAEVEKHISSCSECLRELGELKSAALLVKELPRFRAPKSIAEGVARELATAGQVHTLSKYRKRLSWAVAAAAGLLVVVNVVYFASPDRTAPAPTVAKAPSAAPIGRMAPAEKAWQEKAAGEKSEGAFDLKQQAAPQTAAAPKVGEERKRQQLDSEDGKKLAGAELKKTEEQNRVRDDVARKEGKDAAPMAKDKSATPVPERPAAPGAAAPAPAAPPAVAPPSAPKPAARAEPAKPDALKSEPKPAPSTAPAPEAGRRAIEQRANSGSAEPPATYTIAALQVSKARPRVEETLRKAKLLPPEPAMSKFKAPAPPPANAPLVLELTESEFARLKQELDKQADLKLVAVQPDDASIAMLRGSDGGKAAAGGAPMKKDFSPPKTTEADRKEAESKAHSEDEKAGKAEKLDRDVPTQVQKGAEPKRRITIHFVEVQKLPAETLPAKK